MNILFELFKLIFRILPRSVGILLYKMEFTFLRVLLQKRFPIEIHCRNSLILNYATPPLSDIDITVICARDNFFPVEAYVKYLKRVLPNIGELHFYDPTEFEKTKIFINYFEKKRDPLLNLACNKNDLEIQKTIFLIKMYGHAKFSERAIFRKEKWKKYFELCKLPTNFNTYEECKYQIETFLPSTLSSHLNKSFQGKEVNLFFHFSQWLTLSKQFNSISDDFNQLKHLDATTKKLLEYLILWELWGTLGQARLNIDHLFTCRNILELLNSEANEHIISCVNSYLG